MFHYISHVVGHVMSVKANAGETTSENDFRSLNQLRDVPWLNRAFFNMSGTQKMLTYPFKYPKWKSMRKNLWIQNFNLLWLIFEECWKKLWKFLHDILSITIMFYTYFLWEKLQTFGPTRIFYGFNFVHRITQDIAKKIG